MYCKALDWRGGWLYVQDIPDGPWGRADEMEVIDYLLEQIGQMQDEIREMTENA